MMRNPHALASARTPPTAWRIESRRVRLDADVAGAWSMQDTPLKQMLLGHFA